MHIEDITPKNNTDTDNEDDIARFDYYRKYYELVKPAFLQPTSIKVDVELFNEEIKEYHNIFRRWGYNRDHNPRFGISLFNLDGDIDGEMDYGCSPGDMIPKELDVWEDDFKVKTRAYTDMNSLRVFDPIEEYLIRSNILLFHKGGNFTPHIDTCPLPIRDYDKQSRWNLRLWGNTDPDNYIFDNRGHVNKDLEPGRIYLVDVTQWHIAQANADWNYTFFIALRQEFINEAHKWLI
tara:strand:- start:6800 stop:7507 length:708 start_codon:yes stop_codon:yes gene_type:complete